VGVLSGGGSGQVDPPGGNAVPPPPSQAAAQGGGFGGFGRGAVWFPSSPMKAIQAKAVSTKVQFDGGGDPAKAAALAEVSDVAIVFVNQHTSEGRDFELTLPDGQDKLIEAVATANPKTIVVLETGGPVNMPWADHVNAILSAWYPGIRGGEAIANLLFGDVNPSGKTVTSFARKEEDWPYAKPFGPAEATSPAPQGGTPAFGRTLPPFDVPYTKEGLKVGYKWFDAEDKVPLFPFGHGLSYTTFAYSGLKVVAGKETQVTFTVKNTGGRAGIEIAQVYVSFPAGTQEPPKRLVGWEPVELRPGESKTVTVTVPALHVAIFDIAKDDWQVAPGEYKFMVGGSSRILPLSIAAKL
jgi:beta-glucosidase